MAWYYEKLSEDDTVVVYGYGRETKVATGQLSYDKKTGDMKVLKVADNDTSKGADWALLHLLDVVKTGYPEKDIVMIG